MKSIENNFSSSEFFYSINKDFPAAELDGDICLFDDKSGEYLNLNFTASYIWKLIETPMQFNTIVKRLCAVFDIDKSKCMNELKTFLDKEIIRGSILIIKQ